MSGADSNSLFVQIGACDSFGDFLQCYQRAAQHLFEAVERREHSTDIMAPPLLFLMRHSMELGYKYTLRELDKINLVAFEAKKYIMHDLAFLHRHLKPSFIEAATKLQVSEELVESFNDYYTRTGKGMQWFDCIDKGSFSFRYPIDTKGQQVFQRGETINLSEVKCLFDSAMDLLNLTADVLSPHYEHYLWCEEQMNDIANQW